MPRSTTFDDIYLQVIEGFPYHVFIYIEDTYLVNKYK